MWQYRQSADNISIEDTDSEDENTDFSDTSGISTPLPDTDMAFFDPLKSDTEGADGSNSEWLVSAMNACAKLESVKGEEDDEDLPGLSIPDLPEELRSGDDLRTPTEEDSSALPLNPGSCVINQNDVTDGVSRITDITSSDTASSSAVDDLDPCQLRSDSKVEYGTGDLTMSPIRMSGDDVPFLPDADILPSVPPTLGSLDSQPNRMSASSSASSPARGSQASSNTSSPMRQLIEVKSEENDLSCTNVFII